MFEECPAFERNKFKPGDRARAYTSHGFVDFDIKRVQGDKIYIVEDGFDFYYNFKQCRLLKEIKDKIYWIKKGDAFSIGRGVMNTEPNDSENWIKVITTK